MLKKHLLLEKTFLKSVFAIAIPIALQNVISFGVNAMDSIMLGKLGNTAVAGANLGGQPFFLLMLVGFGLSSGGAVLIAQYWGKGQKDAIRRIMRISMLAITILSFLTALVCFFFPSQIMSLFSTEQEIIEASASYLKILSLGFVFYSLSNNYMMSLRAVEQVKISTFIYGMSFFVNVIGNYSFIFGKFGAPEMGIMGAAVGTTLARMFEFTSVMIYMYFIEKNIGYKMHCMFKIDKTFIKDYIHHALPVVGNELIWGMGSIVTSMIMGRIGSTLVTANSITSVIMQLASVFTFGIANAAAVLCGKTIGQGDKARAQKIANTLIAMAVGFGLFGMTVILLIRNPFLTIYDVTPEAKSAAYNMMFILAMLQPLMAVDIVDIIGVLRGGGDTKMALALDAGGMWFINIPLGIITGFVLKVPAPLIYLAMKSDSFIKIFIGLRRIFSGKWIRTVTRDDF